MSICPVIIAGGSGTRFWPLSRSNKPKQFLTLNGERSLIQSTLDRIKPLAAMENCFIATGKRYIENCRNELPELPVQNIIAEPAARNTLPAIILAAVNIERAFGPSTMIVLPADHYVAKPEALLQALREAAALAEKGLLVTLGITPTAPETGFGYIQGGETINERSLHVAAFKEKPDLATARKYLAAGNYFWNAGIFVMTTTAFFSELANHQPEAMAIADKWLKAPAAEFSQLVESSWTQMPATSIDYGLCENNHNLGVVPVECGWSDVGSWPALADIIEADRAGNICRGTNFLSGVSDSIIFADNGCSIAALGVNDLIIVATGTTTMVLPKSEGQRVKELLELVKKAKPELV